MNRSMILILVGLLLLSACAYAEIDEAVINAPGTMPILAEPGSVTLSLAVRDNSNVVDFETNTMTKHIEELTGVNIEFVLFPNTDAQAKMDLLVSSGSKLPDILTVGISDDLRRFNYGQSGIILPLNDYYEKLGAAFHNRCEQAGLDPDTVLANVTSPDGMIYGAPFYDWHIPNVLSQRGWINQTWLDTLGLEVPTNADELYEVLTAFRDGDPNGNGVADEIPMIGNSKTWHSDALDYLMNMFIYSDNDATNYYLPFSVTGGALDVAYDKPEYQEFLRYANKLVTEGLLSPLSFTQDSTQYRALVAQTPTVLGFSVNVDYIDFTTLEDEFVPLAPMSGPGDAQFVTTYVPPCNAQMAISASCEYPEVAFLFMDYQNTDKWERMYFRWGEEGVDWRRAEEGDLNPYEPIGIKSDIVLFNALWGTPNNQIWNGACEFPAIVTGDQQMCSPSSENAPEFMYAKHHLLSMDYAIEFDDIVSKIIYTAEEYDQWNDLRTAVKSYVKEARTLFAMGEMSVDDHWDQYIAELNNMQYKQMLAADQVAYDRMNAK